MSRPSALSSWSKDMGTSTTEKLAYIMASSRKEATKLNKLIIVESPTKARTISQYLGKDYQVLSSQGHVRDLPTSDLGVDVKNGFVPKFETKRNKHIKAVREAARDVAEVYLATDYDREGEAIAYNLYTILRGILNDEEAFSRLVFNEITKPVILKALANPTQIDLKKVEAQRTRRILDRLVGYQVSPLLSKALAGSRFEGLSAGRVQSVALRFLCEREAEIAHFTPEEYWEIDVHLTNQQPFVATLTKKDGKKKFVVRSQLEADAVEEDLRQQEVVIGSLTEKERLRQPLPPFITSSLQQTASSVLGFSPQRTMRAAQALYEGVFLPEGSVGLITYMRTDSVRISEEAIQAAREVIQKQYGEPYLSSGVRRYKNRKRSQDAHEAIRPTFLNYSPDTVASYLTPDQSKLYTLIYNRFLATQMAPASYRQRNALLFAGPYTLEAGGSTLTFDGFLTLFPEQLATEDKLPDKLKEGEILAIDSIEKRQKFTEPPRRYSEAGLINLLEKKGIGRPSTYASIVSIIQERRYAVKEKGSLRPTLLGQVVVEFLKRYFSETVEEHFTAHMEENLDRIEEGELTRLEVLNEFYGSFSERLNALANLISNGNKPPLRVTTDVPCDKCGALMELRYWKGSHFLGCPNYPTCRHTKSLPLDLPIRYEDGALIIRKALEAMAEVSASMFCPECGNPMALKTGRYGRYYRCTHPACGKTAPVSTGISCPACKQGVLVEKYSQKRQSKFYSCSNYPVCRFAVSETPVKVCPVCERGILTTKNGSLRCSNKKCTYRETLSSE